VAGYTGPEVSAAFAAVLVQLTALLAGAPPAVAATIARPFDFDGNGYPDLVVAWPGRDPGRAVVVQPGEDAAGGQAQDGGAAFGIQRMIRAEVLTSDPAASSRATAQQPAPSGASGYLLKRWGGGVVVQATRHIAADGALWAEQLDPTLAGRF
jgi:hypothetical protein